MFSKALLGLHLVLAITGAILFTNQAGAVSAYDDYYHTTNSLNIYNSPSGTPTCEEDLTNTWPEWITNNENYSNYQNPTVAADIVELQSSWQEALNNGRWGVTKESFLGGNQYTAYTSMVVYWTEDTSLALDWDFAPGYVFAESSTGQMSAAVIMCNGSTNQVENVGFFVNLPNAVLVNSTVPDIDPGSASDKYQNFLLYTDHSNLPLGYEGEAIKAGDEDIDLDGLDLIQELKQGTVDAAGYNDTDYDGLSDMVESVWYVDRTDVFCNTAPNPDVCALPDPVKQDIYVEIDWMSDATNSTLYKPTNSQLSIVEEVFDDKDINIHFDTGNYGGGNVLPDFDAELERTSISSVPDFQD